MRIALLATLLLGCGGASYGYKTSAASPMAQAGGPAGPAAPPLPTANGGNSSPVIPEALVIEGSVYVEVGEIKDIVPALRAQVEGAGGRVIAENVSGGEESWSATLKLRLPPDKVEAVVTFLAARGDITSKVISATDVSKQLFDQELAIKNLRTTFDRLAKLMETGGLQVAQILEIEREMTRIRGQIDQLEGDQRYLKDRVALATLDIYITRRDGAVEVAKAKVYPGVRAAMLTLFDPGNRARTRFGGGFVLHTVFRNASLEVDLFQKERDEAGTDSSSSLIATFGGAAYSDFLGGGKRQYLNPYIGGRLGYGYLDAHRFVLQGEAGVELFKSTYVIVDVSARATGFIGKDTDLGLVTAAGVSIAF